MGWGVGAGGGRGGGVVDAKALTRNTMARKVCSTPSPTRAERRQQTSLEASVPQLFAQEIQLQSQPEDDTPVLCLHACCACCVSRRKHSEIRHAFTFDESTIIFSAPDLKAAVVTQRVCLTRRR